MLARSAHDRIAHRRTDSSWLARVWSDPSTQVLVVSAEGTVAAAVVPEGRALQWLAPSAAPDGLRVLLGESSGTVYFAVLTAEPAPVAGAQLWQGLRALAVELSALDSGLLTAAVALSAWHALHPRCPRCGTPTVAINAGWARSCPADESQHFPRTDPAVIMLVTDDTGRALLGRSSSWPPGRFSTLAGFVEAGESAEAAVAREVAEEVGVNVTDIQYFASQPHPFPASLMLGFTARLAGDPTLRLDDDEIAEANWFTRADVRRAVDWGQDEDSSIQLRALPPKMSIARQLIDTWLAAQ